MVKIAPILPEFSAQQYAFKSRPPQNTLKKNQDQQGYYDYHTKQYLITLDAMLLLLSRTDQILRLLPMHHQVSRFGMTIFGSLRKPILTIVYILRNAYSLIVHFT